MPDIITDGTTRVYYVPTISNIAAPTTTELNAGTQLDTIMTPDGLIGFEPDTADVDNSSLSSTFDTKLAGRASFSNTGVRLKKQSATADTVYNLLVRNLTGYIAVRRGVTSSTAWTSGDKLEVYPIICGEVSNQPPEANSVQRYMVPLKITTTPNLRASVA